MHTTSEITILMAGEISGKYLYLLVANEKLPA